MGTTIYEGAFRRFVQEGLEILHSGGQLELRGERFGLLGLLPRTTRVSHKPARHDPESEGEQSQKTAKEPSLGGFPLRFFSILRKKNKRGRLSSRKSHLPSGPRVE